MAPAVRLDAREVLSGDERLAALVEAAAADAPAVAGVREVLLSHLAAPHTPARALAAACGVDLDVVRAAYRVARTGEGVRALVESAWYPYRLRCEFAAATLAQWARRPEIPLRILAREPVVGETMEIHPTRGTCNFRCLMCLWSDQADLTYTSRQLDAGGLMSIGDWLRVLGELHDAGVRRLVVSGGGEPLINPDLPAILETAADLFDIRVYTTGFSLRPGTRLFEALLRCRRVRFSVHSPDPATYDRIAGTRPGQHALDKVTGNLSALLRDRDAETTIGIGIVILGDNHHQIEAMANLADTLGVDWLDLRKDEVDVTAGLDIDAVRQQLRAVRSTSYRSRIDIGDELVAIANGLAVDRTRTSECMARWLRPTIGAYGHVTPCDLKAEPRFAATGHVLGNVKGTRLLPVIAASKDRRIADDCAQCMPSSRTGNAIVHKILTDLHDGMGLDEQPFAIG